MISKLERKMRTHAKSIGQPLTPVPGECPKAKLSSLVFLTLRNLFSCERESARFM
jgi:hypothetical protein